MVRLEGVQILVSQNLASSLQHLYIDLKKFLFFRNLTAAAELSNGLVLGRAVSPSADQIWDQVSA